MSVEMTPTPAPTAVEPHHHLDDPDAIPRLSMTWQDIKYKAGDREILVGITGAALPGRALAIMGSSGAGKTTFLNCISDRIAESSTLIYSGQVRIGGVAYEHKYRKLIGFVTQEDILPATATPTEAFTFTVRTRRGVTPEEAAERVDDTIKMLRLTKAKDTIVGVPGLVAGLSGGERKRCNIGTELIADPAVLLLDEPTSGLDSVTAVSIVATLKELAAAGRTVIYTIHQPTASCLALFDDLMLMCAGAVVYHGAMSDAVEYFAQQGYVCPETHTPSDFFMTLLQDEAIGPLLVEKWRARIANIKNTPDDPLKKYVDVSFVQPEQQTPDERTAVAKVRSLLDTQAAAGSSASVQASELFARSFKNIARNRMYLGVLVLQNLFFAIIAGLIFVRLTDDVQGVQDRAGLIFMLATNYVMSSAMGAVNTFPAERAVFVREQQCAAYSPGIYLLAKSMSELPMQLFGSLLSCVVVYFLTGLNVSAGGFFYFYAVIVCTQQASAGIGLAISSAFENYAVATGVAPMLLIPLVVSGGLFASTDRLRPYWYWTEKISIPRYGYVLLMKNEFSRVGSISCDVAKYGPAFCARQPKNGTQAIEAVGLSGSQDDEWIMWMCIAIMFVAMRILSTLGLYRVARSKS